MESIEVEVRIEKLVDVEVSISDVIDAINDLSIRRRWAYVAKLIGKITVGLEGLTEEEKETVQKYLKEKLELFTTKEMR
jgi:hypothetical protein